MAKDKANNAPSGPQALKEFHTDFLPASRRIDTLLAQKPPRFRRHRREQRRRPKTALADQLACVYDCNVFHMDDFFLRRN